MSKNNIDTTEYWKEAYNTIQVPKQPSAFANEIISKLPNRDLSIVDLGCGNGRDVKFFETYYSTVHGMDAIKHKDYLGDIDNLLLSNISNISIQADIYYARFFVHAIQELDLDMLVKYISSKGGYFCIETRSSRDITDEPKSITNFISSIGEAHFRVLYSLEYLKHKLEDRFEFLYTHEGINLAKFESENPQIIRIICKSKDTI